jgi:ATP-binding cassette subfamily B (MDR/TAP) protein 1
MYFTAVTKQEMGFFDIKKSGKILSTLSEDIGSLVDGFTLRASLFSQYMGQFIIGIILALIASWQTSLVMLAGGVPTVGSIMFFCGLAINLYNKKIMHLSASALSTANEVIGSIRTVRSMAGEEREQHRFGNDLRKIFYAGLAKSLATALSKISLT